MRKSKGKCPEWVEYYLRYLNAVYPELRMSAKKYKNRRHYYLQNDNGKFAGSSSEPIDNSAKSGIIKSSEDFSYISATGPNEFEKGFSYSNLVNHWYGNDYPKITSHKREYEARGYDMKGYGELALDLIQKPVGNGILGHKTADGFVVRYNTKTGDFVKGNPKRGIKTMFMASLNYYNNQKIVDEEAFL